MFTFKFKGHEYQPERLNGKQIAAGLLYYFFSISTKTYRTTRTTRANDWKKHAERLQKELDAERAAGWGFCYLTGRRIDFNLND